MPVVVTGASGGVGRVLIPALAGRGEVRAVVRSSRSAETLRASGAKVAVCDLGETSALTTIMDGAHTVIHLAGGLDLPDDAAYETANLATARDALEAAADANAARFLFMSYPGASSSSGNAYLRAKGLAEEAVAASGLDHLILRCTHVYGPGQAWFEEMRRSASRPLAATVIGSGQQRLAPVHVRDVVAGLVAADDRAEPVSGNFALQGPDVVTADEIVDLIAGRHRRKLHLGPDAARRASSLLGRRLHPALVEILAADSLADAPDAAKELSVSLTSLSDGLREALNGVRGGR
ncbi:MAG: SDR family oxidoreductase [Actinomycetota bacterium]